MKFPSASSAPYLLLTAAAAAASSANAAPNYNHNHNQFVADNAALAGLDLSTGLTSHLSSSIASILSPLTSIWKSSHSDAPAAATWDLTSADHSDKSIYDVITTDEHFTQLAKAVRYSSEHVKDLLKGKGDEKLTIFAPVNVHREHHAKDLKAFEDESQGGAASSLMQATSSWQIVEDRIAEFEEQELTSDDEDNDKERRRRRLAHFIDAVLLYHLVDSKHEVFARELLDFSTVPTKLSIHGKAAEYIGKLNDGLPLRLRVFRSLIPQPGVYLNFYSRVIHPDVKLANGVLHAVQYPLFQFPSILQGLFSGQPQFSTLTSALLKLDAEGYLALPIPKRHRDNHNHTHEEDFEIQHHHRLPHNAKRGLADKKGTAAATLFAPSNVAWDALPWSFRAYLFSPWGAGLLGKIIMLHSIPRDIVYADSVHHVHHHNGKHRQVQGVTVTYDEPRLIAKMWGANDENLPMPHSSATVTRYTVDSVLPKLPDDGEGELPPPDEATEFEQVDVEVWRYHLLPNNKGPRHTAVKVQGNWAPFPDIVNLNGASHYLTHFIKPKGHPSKGLWAEVAQQAEAHGFGSVDLNQEMKSQAW